MLKLPQSTILEKVELHEAHSVFDEHWKKQ